MPFITVELLRKRAEHNEGCLSDLKEVALHQQELERLSVVGDVCRQLEILYLSNNYIPRIEGLTHLKHLTYLNLAINNIKVVEGLEGCEMLEKLDLTLNFIAEYESVRKLRANPFLKILHLTGNPCTDIPDYRLYVVENLPQLQDLDGQSVQRSEIISARQDRMEAAEKAKVETVKAREQERIHEEMRSKGIDPFPAKFNEEGERLYGHSAEERIQMLKEQQAEEEKKKKQEEEQKKKGSIYAAAAEINKKEVTLTPEEEMEKYGRVLLRNEGKFPFTMNEGKLDTTLFPPSASPAYKQYLQQLQQRKQEQQQQQQQQEDQQNKKSGTTSSTSTKKKQPEPEEGVILTVEPGRFISTASIDIRMEPTFCRITVKGKILQLVFETEVASDRVKVQRSTTTGQLRLEVPFAAHVVQEKIQRKKKYEMLEDEDLD